MSYISPTHMLPVGFLTPVTNTIDELLLRKLLHTVQLLQSGQTDAADLMLTHVMGVLDRKHAADATLYPIAQKLATDILFQRAEALSNTFIEFVDHIT